METRHIPVLCDEVIRFLKPKPGGTYIDGTVGLGGHSTALLAASAPNGHVIGIDVDPAALAVSRNRLHRFGDRYTLLNGNFAEMDTLLLERDAISAGTSSGAPSVDGGVDGILLDLGVSSLQLDTPTRGFSFTHTGPLDMRMNNSTEAGTQTQQTAMQVINESSQETLTDIFRRYGEERFAKRIARRIVQTREAAPITTTTQFADLIKQSVPASGAKIHPATRVFQALRIHLNSELENLATGLAVAIQLLKPGGRMCVISFHSLEDRIVKRCFQEHARACICPPKIPICVCEHTASLEILTKRPVVPGTDECENNRRARSAKLRAARKL